MKNISIFLFLCSFSSQIFAMQFPLHAAVKQGKIRVVKELLEANACDINEYDASGDTALHSTKTLGNHVMLTVLLRYGPDVNKVDRQGLTILDYAILDYRSVQVGLLLRHKAAINYPSSSALHTAAHSSSEDILELLLGHGADVNRQDNSGITPVHLVLGLNNNGFKKLLQAHYNIDLQDNNGNTLFHIMPFVWPSMAGEFCDFLKKPQKIMKTLLLIQKHRESNLKNASIQLFYEIADRVDSNCQTVRKYKQTLLIKNNAGKIAYEYALDREKHTVEPLAYARLIRLLEPGSEK